MRRNCRGADLEVTKPGQDTQLEQKPDSKGAAVKVPPPLILVTVIACAYGMHQIIPLAASQSIRLATAGYLLIALASGIILTAAWSFYRFKTHIEPWKPTSKIISTGIFSHSRNPIYLGFCVATPGVGLVLNSWWIILSVVPLAALLYLLVIRLEESYLLRKFGDKYANYHQRVRRWL